MKYAKRKPVGDFLVTAILGKRKPDYTLVIEHKDSKEVELTADIFYIEGTPPGGRPPEDATLQCTFSKVRTPFRTTIQPRAKETHIRINSPEAAGGIEVITR